MTFDIGYDMTTQYRMFRPSISIASILRTFDIKGCNKPSISNQYNFEKSSISKPGTQASISTQYNIEETSISKFRTSISLYPDTEDFSISTNPPSISVYDIEAVCFDIECLVLRYRYFFVGSSLGCCSSYSVLDTDCGVHITLRIIHDVAHAPLGPPSAAAAEAALGGAAAPAAAPAASAAAGSVLGPAEYVKLNLVPESP
jgi:hypothetical protein